ncbi:hypothetical protein DBV15_05513 [Temnothorax longispinosus]|uniref:Uncharacterized protein n=1 Tax=Temnothorax longispinosus TaxID=300112 RepID=A0A4S2KG19_9HYME|nr:hypothetical protein DBV15_05513 [Temnothorax longispinosus]
MGQPRGVRERPKQNRTAARITRVKMHTGEIKGVDKEQGQDDQGAGTIHPLDSTQRLQSREPKEAGARTLWCLFLLNLRRNCPAAGLLAVKSCEKCHESEATTIRFSAEKRQGSGDNQDRRNCRNVVRALNEKCVRHSCWGLRVTSRCSFSDESSIIGKYDKRAAPPTKGIGTVKNLAELTLQIRTYLAIGGPSERRPRIPVKKTFCSSQVFYKYQNPFFKEVSDIHPDDALDCERFNRLVAGKVKSRRRTVLKGSTGKRSTGLTDLPVQVHLGIPVARQFKTYYILNTEMYFFAMCCGSTITIKSDMIKCITKPHNIMQIVRYRILQEQFERDTKERGK